MSLGLIPKVIPVKLFLDIVPSSFEVVTPAMRGLPKGFSRNYLREMAANLVKSRLYVLTFKRCFVPDLFSALSFCSAGPSFALCSLAVHYFAVYSVLRNLSFGCRDGAVVRALASHQWGPGSIPSRPFGLVQG